MSDFTITERTEPFTLDEVFNFIDDTNISEIDSCELKSRIVDAVQGIRAKAIDEFLKNICEKYTEEERKGNHRQYCVSIKQDIAEIAEQLKGGAK